MGTVVGTYHVAHERPFDGFLAQTHARAGMAVTEDDVLEALQNYPDPVATATELAELLPIQRRAVLQKLKVLEARGGVEGKKVGGRAAVWWAVDKD